jgi:hypothetical protein
LTPSEGRARRSGSIAILTSSSGIHLLTLLHLLQLTCAFSSCHPPLLAFHSCKPSTFRNLSQPSAPALLTSEHLSCQLHHCISQTLCATLSYAVAFCKLPTCSACLMLCSFGHPQAAPTPSPERVPKHGSPHSHHISPALIPLPHFRRLGPFIPSHLETSASTHPNLLASHFISEQLPFLTESQLHLPTRHHISTLSMSDNEQGASGRAGAWTEDAKVDEKWS